MCLARLAQRAEVMQELVLNAELYGRLIDLLRRSYDVTPLLDLATAPRSSPKS